MQPQDKPTTIERVSASHAELVVALDQLTPEEMTAPGVNGEWTVKDMLAHITWWEQHLLRRLRSGRDEVYDGVTEREEGRRRTDAANARTYAENRDRPLEDVLADFRASYAETLAYLEAMPEEELARPDVAEPVGFDTYDHYAEHIQMLQAWRSARSTES